MKLAIIIPVYNEGKVIRGVINSIPKKIKGIDKITIIAVNDGSTDDSLEEIKKTRAHLVNLPINLGYGGASITGFEAAKEINCDMVVTFDGDGQHDPRDIKNIIKPIIACKSDIVIGTRFANTRGMPLYKKWGIRLMNLIIFCLSKNWVSDSQSGLKAFSKKALDKLTLDTSGMEFASEIIIEAKKSRLVISEVPIRTIYTAYSKSKGQNVLNGVNIIVKIIYKQLVGP